MLGLGIRRFEWHFSLHVSWLMAQTCRRCEGFYKSWFPPFLSVCFPLPLFLHPQIRRYSPLKMSTSHILPLPVPVVALRGLQLLVAIVILGLSAWGLSAISFDAASLALFTAIITLIITAYNVVSFFALKDAYNYVSTQFFTLLFK